MALIVVARVSGLSIVTVVLALAPAVGCAVSVTSAVLVKDATILPEDLAVHLVDGARIISRVVLFVITTILLFFLTVALAMAPSELGAVPIALAVGAGVASVRAERSE